MSIAEVRLWYIKSLSKAKYYGKPKKLHCHHDGVKP